MLAACRVAAYGGAPMPAAWIADLAARRPHLRLANVYGLTEYTSLSHTTAPRRRPRQPSAGPSWAPSS